MGLRKYVDWVPAPFGDHDVPLESYECDGLTDECPDECTAGHRCDICGKVYCGDEYESCPEGCDESRTERPRRMK